MVKERRARGLVKAVDTNVLARMLMRDDESQAAAAEQIMASADILLPHTVLLETVWLLMSRYGLRREDAIDRLILIVRMNNVVVPDEPGVRWALGRTRAGADFADMMHLIQARDAEAFVTFDRALAKGAGSQPPVSVETLA